jgi:hypothetical protein
MAARWIAAQSVADKTVETVEGFSHAGRPSRHVDPRRQPKSEHRLCSLQYGKQTFQRRHVESTPHADPAAVPNSTHSAHPLLLPDTAAITSTDRSRLSPAARATNRCCRRYLSSDATLNSRPAQNACRVNPLASYSPTSCFASSRLIRRRRCNNPTPTSLMPSGHHKPTSTNRCDALTNTVHNLFQLIGVVVSPAIVWRMAKYARNI